VGHDTLKMGVLDAVLTFNEGNVGRVKVLQCLGIDPGVNAVKSFQEILSQRIKTSKIELENKNQEIRKLNRNEKKEPGNKKVILMNQNMEMACLLFSEKFCFSKFRNIFLRN